MMKNWLLILCVMGWQLAPQDALAAKRFPVETAVEVVDVDGNPLPGVTVNLSYLTLVETIRPERQRATTDAEGRVRFEGRGYRRISIYIHEDGYYGHRESHEIIEFLDGEPQALGEIESRIVLKEIRNPIVMLATRDFRPILPGPDERVGFDFFVNDLVEPYGEGRRADVYFLLEGEFQDRLNHDSALTVEFAGEGDGLIPFEMDYNSGSILESGHEAPETGYERVKRTRKSIWTRKGLRPKQPGYVEYERANEVRGDVGYYIRIRTELDEDGNVISAYYGKIYGDFDFYGARPGGSFVTADAYYINPNPNDRNVEAVPGETLLEGVSRLDLPNRL